MTVGEINNIYALLAITAVAFTLLAAVWRITAKYEKVKFSLKEGVEINDSDNSPSKETKGDYTVIRYDDWRRFSEELYNFCMKLTKPDNENLYIISRFYDGNITVLKKSYIERAINFNHLPKNKTEEYNEYISTQAKALINSVCNSIFLICRELTAEVPPFDETKIAKSLSILINKYRK